MPPILEFDAGTWVLLGFATGIMLGIIVMVAALFSRDWKRGLTTIVSERLFEGMGSRKEKFLPALREELLRRGILVRKPLTADIDLIYHDFYDEVKIQIVQVGPHLRYAYRISASRGAIVLGIILLIPFVIGSVALFVLAVIRRQNTIRSLEEAGSSAAIISKSD